MVDLGSWTIPNSFQQLELAGEVPRAEMLRAFNLGVGIIVVTSADSAAAVIASASAADVPAWRLGHVVPGSGRVILSEDRT